MQSKNTGTGDLPDIPNEEDFLAFLTNPSAEQGIEDLARELANDVIGSQKTHIVLDDSSNETQVPMEIKSALPFEVSNSPLTSAEFEHYTILINRIPARLAVPIRQVLIELGQGLASRQHLFNVVNQVIPKMLPDFQRASMLARQEGTVNNEESSLTGQVGHLLLRTLQKPEDMSDEVWKEHVLSLVRDAASKKMASKNMNSSNNSRKRPQDSMGLPQSQNFPNSQDQMKFSTKISSSPSLPQFNLYDTLNSASTKRSRADGNDAAVDSSVLRNTELTSAFSSKPQANKPRPNEPSVDTFKLGIDALKDVTSYANINLLEESEKMMKDSLSTDEFNTLPFDDTEIHQIQFEFMKKRVEGILSKNRLTAQNTEFYNVLSLALQIRLKNILEESIVMCHHREEVGRDHFKVIVTQEPRKQLQLIMKYDQDTNKRFLEGGEVEMEKEPDAEAVGKVDSASIAAEKLQDNPFEQKAIISAINYGKEDTEAVKTRMANVTAMRAFGLPKKSWMTLDVRTDRGTTEQRTVPTLPTAAKSIAADDMDKMSSAPVQIAGKLFRRDSPRKVTLLDVLNVMERDPQLRKSKSTYIAYLHMR